MTELDNTFLIFTPPPNLTATEWADEHFYLSPESSSEPGKYSSARTPYVRTILDELRRKPRTTGQLCGLFAMTRFGVMKHLRALEEAGLVLVERRGRERWNHLNPTPIREIYRRWIRPFAEEEADKLLRLKRVAEGSGDRTDKNKRRPKR